MSKNSENSENQLKMLVLGGAWCFGGTGRVLPWSCLEFHSSSGPKIQYMTPLQHINIRHFVAKYIYIRHFAAKYIYISPACNIQVDPTTKYIYIRHFAAKYIYIRHFSAKYIYTAYRVLGPNTPPVPGGATGGQDRRWDLGVHRLIKNC